MDNANSIHIVAKLEHHRRLYIQYWADDNADGNGRNFKTVILSNREEHHANVHDIVSLRIWEQDSNI